MLPDMDAILATHGLATFQALEERIQGALTPEQKKLYVDVS